jgi:hypothetical protein
LDVRYKIARRRVGGGGEREREREREIILGRRRINN